MTTMDRNSLTLSLICGFSIIVGCTTTSPKLSPESVLSSIELPSEKKTVHPLEITFLGNTTISLQSNGSGLVIDGFVSRPSRSKILFGIKPDPGLVKKVFQEAGVESVHTVIPLHSHFDHLLDAPVLAYQKRAELLASETSRSIANNMQRFNCIGQINLLPTSEFSEKGVLAREGFRVKLEKSHHIDTKLVGRIFAPRGESLTDEDISHVNFCEPVISRHYVEGDSFNIYVSHTSSGTKLAVLTGAPSTGLNGKTCKSEPEAHPLCSTDLVFVSLSLFDEELNNDLSVQLLELLESKKTNTVLVPVHWDAFFLPLLDPMLPIERNNRLRMAKTSSMVRAHKKINQRLSQSRRVKYLWMTAFDKLYIGD